jgi:hypothetical protein
VLGVIITLTYTAVSFFRISNLNDWFFIHWFLYTFAFNLSSSLWGVSSFGFSLVNQDGTVVGSDTSSTTGSAASIVYNTVNDTRLNMNYYRPFVFNKEERTPPEWSLLLNYFDWLLWFIYATLLI